MSNKIRQSLTLSLSLLSATWLPAGSAFERAARDEQGRVIVENLIIGCSTHPGVQEGLNKRFAPHSVHDHKAEDWVSFDLNPEMRPDIVGDIEQIEKHIGRITGQVYLEHLNDGANKGVAYTYQGALVTKLYDLMAPGAKLYLDFYPGYHFISQPVQGLHFLNHEKSPYLASPANGVQPWNNPFWFQATWEHFFEAIQPGSRFDDFGGRLFALRYYIEEMQDAPAFMARIPAELRKKGAEQDLRRYLAAAAEQNLDRQVKARECKLLVEPARVFYGARAIPAVLQFLVEAGFSDARLQMGAVNPFNGRKGEWLLVASKPKLGEEGKGDRPGPGRDSSDREGRH
jgi:hypothetical protein